ncbi:hypothetical protein OG204_19115 [Streptomyces sp. NBC_01387]|uniref:hypothetical protein n=1 Tax=unclassified Streptomyces TaxID=2593676 RepID=UPI00202440E0|nr:hypothetical protein [Streptomyces sp. A 4/2]
MTSRTDAAQHPDASEISDLSILAPSRAASVRKHLGGCSSCAEIKDSLDEIQKLLGRLPDPVEMPSDIADRIDAALAAEALRDVDGGEKTTHVSRETSRASLAAESARTSRPSGHPRAGTGPGRTRTVRRRRHVAALSAAFGAAVIGVSVFFLQSSLAPSHGDTRAAENTSKRGEAPVFAESALRGQVHSLLATDTPPASVASPHEKEAPSVHLDSSPKALKKGLAVVVPPCVESGIGRDESPLAAQKGTYKGVDAFLVVLPHPTDSSRIQAYVVDAACVDAVPPVRGKVLLTHVYPRG